MNLNGFALHYQSVARSMLCFKVGEIVIFCLCCFSVSELKMENVLASLMKDDRFKLHRPRSKVSYSAALELLQFSLAS